MQLAARSSLFAAYFQLVAAFPARDHYSYAGVLSLFYIYHTINSWSCQTMWLDITNWELVITN